VSLTERALSTKPVNVEDYRILAHTKATLIYRGKKPGEFLFTNPAASPRGPLRNRGGCSRQMTLEEPEHGYTTDHNDRPRDSIEVAVGVLVKTTATLLIIVIVLAIFTIEVAVGILIGR
jgi:hypothetical protein